MKYVDPMGREKVLLAINETVDVLKRIIKGECGNLSVHFISGYPIKLTDSEYNMYRNRTILNLFDLNNNKKISSDNDYYNNEIEKVEESLIYKQMYSIYGDDMFVKLGRNLTNNNYIDALRHSYFNALNYKDYGSIISKEIGDNHELFKGNNGITAIIDLFNNSIGRSIAKENSNKNEEQLLIEIINNKNKLIYGHAGIDGKWYGNNLFNTVYLIIQTRLLNEL